MENLYKKERNKLLESMEAIGLAATFIRKKEDGSVHVTFLEPERITQLLSFYDDPKDIPFEYTIYNECGEKITL